MKLQVDVKLLRYHINTESGQFVTLKDLRNLRAPLHPNETKTEAAIRVLQDFSKDDEGGKLAKALADDGTLEALFLQTSAMVASFHKYPEIVKTT